MDVTQLAFLWAPVCQCPKTETRSQFKFGPSLMEKIGLSQFLSVVWATRFLLQYVLYLVRGARIPSGRSTGRRNLLRWPSIGITGNITIVAHEILFAIGWVFMWRRCVVETQNYGWSGDYLKCVGKDVNCPTLAWRTWRIPWKLSFK